MALDIRYNVYYSTGPKGPWTLANETPIVHSSTGNCLEILGLSRGTLYYVMVVGGIMSGGDFIPLTTQPLRPGAEKAAGIGNIVSDPVAFRYHEIRKALTDQLTHQFLQAINYDAGIYQEFDVDQATRDNSLNTEFNLDEVDAYLVEAGNYTTSPFTTPLAQEFHHAFAASGVLGYEFSLLLQRTQALNHDFFQAGSAITELFEPSGFVGEHLTSVDDKVSYYTIAEFAGVGTESRTLIATHAVSGLVPGKWWKDELKWDQNTNAGTNLPLVTSGSFPHFSNSSFIIRHDPIEDKEIRFSLDPENTGVPYYWTAYAWVSPDDRVSIMGADNVVDDFQDIGGVPFNASWTTRMYEDLPNYTNTGLGKYLCVMGFKCRQNRNETGAVIQGRMYADGEDRPYSMVGLQGTNDSDVDPMLPLFAVVNEDQRLNLEVRYTNGSSDAYEFEECSMYCIPIGCDPFRSGPQSAWKGLPNRLIATTDTIVDPGIAGTWQTLQQGTVWCPTGTMTVAAFATWGMCGPWWAGCLQVQMRENGTADWIDIVPEIWNTGVGQTIVPNALCYPCGTGVILQVNETTFPGKVEADKTYEFRLRYKPLETHHNQYINESLLVVLDGRVVFT